MIKKMERWSDREQNWPKIIAKLNEVIEWANNHSCVIEVDEEVDVNKTDIKVDMPYTDVKFAPQPKNHKRIAFQEPYYPGDVVGTVFCPTCTEVVEAIHRCPKSGEYAPQPAEKDEHLEFLYENGAKRPTPAAECACEPQKPCLYHGYTITLTEEERKWLYEYLDNKPWQFWNHSFADPIMEKLGELRQGGGE